MTRGLDSTDHAAKRLHEFVSHPLGGSRQDDRAVFGFWAHIWLYTPITSGRNTTQGPSATVLSGACLLVTIIRHTTCTHAVIGTNMTLADVQWSTTNHKTTLHASGSPPSYKTLAAPCLSACSSALLVRRAVHHVPALGPAHRATPRAHTDAATSNFLFQGGNRATIKLQCRLPQASVACACIQTASIKDTSPKAVSPIYAPTAHRLFCHTSSPAYLTVPAYCC